MLPEAVPSIFPNLPAHFSKSIPEKRSESTSTSARFQRQSDIADFRAQEFLTADEIASLIELKEKIELENLPEGILKSYGEDKITFFALGENDLGMPFVKFSLMITEDLAFSMWCNELKILPAKVAHLCKDGKLVLCSAVINIIQVLKNMWEETVIPPSNAIDFSI